MACFSGGDHLKLGHVSKQTRYHNFLSICLFKLDFFFMTLRQEKDIKVGGEKMYVFFVFICGETIRFAKLNDAKCWRVAQTKTQSISTIYFVA